MNSLGSEEPTGSKTPASSSNVFSTPSPSQCAAVPPSASKSKTPKDKDYLAEFMDRAKFIKSVEQDREDFEEILHKKRMSAILNEVKFLEETDWMYPSVENILGFKDERPIMLATRFESSANLAEAHMFRVARGTERNS